MILLSDEEIFRIEKELDPRPMFFLPHRPVSEFEDRIRKGQVRKVVELFRRQESGKIAATTYYKISEKLLQAILKEIK